MLLDPGGPTTAPVTIGRTRRERPRAHRAVTTHRNAALAALEPGADSRGQQLLRGGIPAVRQAIEEQNTRARSKGGARCRPNRFLTMAEELLPRMNLAAWKDRAVALRSAGREAPLREMRSVVAGASTVPLDEEGRILVTALRESLDTRVAALRVAWLGRIIHGARRQPGGRRAAGGSAKPAGTHGPGPRRLAVRLAETAGTAMAPTMSEDLDRSPHARVIKSPVRRTVNPTGLPPDASPELLTAARHAAGLVPELARLLGLPIPPATGTPSGRSRGCPPGLANRRRGPQTAPRGRRGTRRGPSTRVRAARARPGHPGRHRRVSPGHGEARSAAVPPRSPGSRSGILGPRRSAHLSRVPQRDPSDVSSRSSRSPPGDRFYRARRTPGDRPTARPPEDGPSGDHQKAPLGHGDASTATTGTGRRGAGGTRSRKGAVHGESRALKPEPSRKFFVTRSPGRAVMSTPVASRRPEPDTRSSSRARPTHARARRLHVTGVDDPERRLAHGSMRPMASPTTGRRRCPQDHADGRRR